LKETYINLDEEMKKNFIYKKPKESESDESEEEEISAGATSCVVLLTET
jgi:hypothetical protein